MHANSEVWKNYSDAELEESRVLDQPLPPKWGSIKIGRTEPKMGQMKPKIELYLRPKS